MAKDFYLPTDVPGSKLPNTDNDLSAEFTKKTLSVSLRGTHPVFRAFLILFSIPIMLSSCLKYEEVKVLGVEDVAVKKFSAKSVELEVSVKIKNPNNYKIKIVGSDLDLFVNGNKSGKAKILDKIVIPKHSEEVHTFIVQANYKEVMAGLKGGIFSILTGGAVPLRIKGKITAKAKMLRKSFEVDITEKVSFGKNK